MRAIIRAPLLLVLGVAAVVLPGPLAYAVEDDAEPPLPPVDVVTPQEGEAKKPEKPAKSAKVDATAPATDKGSGRSGSGIRVLVNDEPITAYEIEQRRAALGSASGAVGEYVRKNAKARWEKLIKSSNINDEFREYAVKHGVQTREQANALQKPFLQAKQKALLEQLKKEALAQVKKGDKDEAIEDLIDERLKVQEAKRLNVLASDEEVNQTIGKMAERNKMTVEQFAAQMKQRGADIAAMKARFRAEISWRDVIRRRFGMQVTVSESEIDRFVAKAPAGTDEVAIEIQKITLPIAGGADQAAIAKRMQEAEFMRGRFSTCKELTALAASLGGAKLENLGARKLSTIPEPTRSLLLEAKNEEVLPPTIDDNGVELWVACGRQTVKADEKVRAAAQDQLRQKEYELLAKRHLKDLRQDAHIEYR